MGNKIPKSLGGENSWTIQILADFHVAQYPNNEFCVWTPVCDALHCSTVHCSWALVPILTLIWDNFLPCWVSLNDSETVKAVTLAFCSIQ